MKINNLVIAAITLLLGLNNKALAQDVPEIRVGVSDLDFCGHTYDGTTYEDGSAIEADELERARRDDAQQCRRDIRQLTTLQRELRLSGLSSRDREGQVGLLEAGRAVHDRLGGTIQRLRNGETVSIDLDDWGRFLNAHKAYKTGLRTRGYGLTQLKAHLDEMSEALNSWSRASAD